MMRLAPLLAATLVALGSALALPARAAQEGEGEASLDTLKLRVLELASRAEAQRNAARDDAEPTIPLLVASADAQAGILAVALSIDDAPELVHRFDAAESQALAQRGAHAFTSLPPGPGEHRLSGHFELRGAAGAEPVIVAFDERRAWSAGATALELRLDAKALLTPPLVHLVELHPAAATAAGGSGLARLWQRLAPSPAEGGGYPSGGADDPRVAQAVFLRRSGRCLDATLQLRSLGDSESATSLPAAYSLELAEALLCYGALEAATESLAHAQRAGLASAAASELRLRIGEQWYQRGELAGARALLGADPGAREPALRAQWQDLQARLLLADRRYGEASAALRDAGHQSDFGSFVRYYNLGVAMLAGGFGQQGATVLDRVGSVASGDPDMMALSDRANLALGAWFLRQGQGATAVPVLERIHSDGPYAQRALLDLGWAWLAPAGQKQARASLGDERTVGPPPGTVGDLNRPLVDQNLYQRYHLRPFARADLGRDDEARLKRALAIWAELVDRDSSDEAVQEGLLAVALVLDRLGAHEGAAGYYQRALTALEASYATVDEARAYVQGPAWASEVLAADDGDEQRVDRQLRRLPKLRVARLLSDRMAGRAFQSGLAQRRELAFLQARVEALLQKPDANGVDAELRASLQSLAADLQSGRGQLDAELRGQMLDELGQRHGVIARLLVDTRMQLARSFEQHSDSRSAVETATRQLRGD